MKINNQSWHTLEIFGTTKNRKILISYLENSMVGCENRFNSSIIYFDKINKNVMDQKIKDISCIDKWSWSKTEEKNWNQKCKDFFQPVIIKNKVEILPYWKKNDDKYLSIKLNPALAFGTGHHETTYMMLDAMLEFDFRNKSVFDIGTGSGILSILAKKLGANFIRAIDNDPLTYNNFYENLELNDVDDIQFEIKDCFDVNQFNFDYIFANINLNILLDLIPLIKSPGTIMIISGILSSDETVIVNAIKKYEKTIKDIYKKNEWLCLVIEL